jgi:predicted short-subunit dehydrogenase-like oxidoreductase (DUF2520 family)
MRELERNVPPAPTPLPVSTGLVVVGRGRLGTALAAALGAGEPLGRDEAPSAGTEIVLLCVPDAEIPAAAEAVAGSARFVGHTSGATPITALELAGTPDVFGLHPLQTVTGAGPARFDGCGCAVAGSTQRALELAEQIATDLGMKPFAVEDSQRAAYHAAASIASNFLVTIEAEAEALAVAAGIEGFDSRVRSRATTTRQWPPSAPRSPPSARSWSRSSTPSSSERRLW